jgi:prephenate dehydrogenase
MDVETPLPSAAVIGLGRFGRFWAEMLSSQFSVVGTSRRTIPDLPAAVRQVELPEALTADYIFLCVAISAMPEVLDRIAPHLPPGATVVDTCSVKVFPVAEMEARLPQEVGIIATHPMFGPDSARERTDRLPVITWPVRDAHQRYRDLTARFRLLDMRVEEMTPEAHDREAAFSQGVTHLVGRLLREMALQPSGIATLGYTRLLQVMEQTCNDPVELFRDLQRYNPYTREMRRSFAAALERTEALLSDGPTGES